MTLTRQFYVRYADMQQTKNNVEMTVEDAGDEVDRIIVEVSTKIASKRSFGYHTPEDMIQQGYFEAVTMLNKDKFDFERPLSNFLFVHIQRRLANLKRSQCYRNESPCKCCDRYTPPAEPCEAWRRWHRNNVERQKVFSPASLASDASILSHEPSPTARLDFNDLDAFIKARLTSDQLVEYELFKTDSLSNAKSLSLKLVLRELLTGTDYDPTN